MNIEKFVYIFTGLMVMIYSFFGLVLFLNKNYLLACTQFFMMGYFLRELFEDITYLGRDKDEQ